ncbi:hypothetical protein ABPG72_010304 [Tetrahymena utriculariae]
MLEGILSEIPPITRTMCGMILLLSVMTYTEIVQPYNLYFNLKLIVFKFQGWRLLTDLFYFGEMKIVTLFKITLFCKFSSKLEDQTFRGNTAKYFYFLLVGALQLTVIASLFGLFNLSGSFETMILYLWCRRNKNAVFHIFGLIPIQAPYLAWFFILMQLFLNQSFISDLAGIIVGHVYYFFYDVYPKLPLSTGANIMKTPRYFVKICKLLKITDEKLPDDEDGNEENADDDNQAGEDIQNQNAQDEFLF